ncbi:MAG: GNAT family N-acetyltransferase [Xanthobacteraceae bacterium]
MLGVDPSCLPSPGAWRKRLDHEFSLPLVERANILVAWTLDDALVGFSTADKIVHGERANMHLHVVDRDRRHQGLGTVCVRESVAIYFSILKLKRLFCEPNAFNVAPNRTLQKAGFKYLKTHMTVPGPLNYHQAVTRWVFEP